MSAYAIRYVDRAAQRKATLSAPQRASLEELERRLGLDPFGSRATISRDNRRAVTFAGGLIIYVVSDSDVVIHAIDRVADA
ncbi:hypothetical protein [Streptomyces sp. NPDC002172]